MDYLLLGTTFLLLVVTNVCDFGYYESKTATIIKDNVLIAINILYIWLDKRMKMAKYDKNDAIEKH